MKKYWNDTRREEINQQREIISSLQQAFNHDSIDERRLSTELDELQTKHTNKVNSTSFNYNFYFSNARFVK
jgi:hypothetical protein